MADYDETKPDGNAAINIGDDTIRDNFAANRERIEKEHYFPDNANSSRQGKHKFSVATLSGLSSSLQDEGNFGFASDKGSLAFHDGAGLVLATRTIGEIVWLSVPNPASEERLIPADGAELSQTTYALYWDALGQVGLYDDNPNGLPAPGAGNFRAPDLRGIAPVGFFSGGDGDAEYASGGDYYGTKKRALTDSEVPAVQDFSGSTGAPSGNFGVPVSPVQNLAADSSHTHTMNHGHSLAAAAVSETDLRQKSLTLYPFVYVGV